MAATSDKDYISCADTAKLVRAALKQSFPGVKFSVRSKVYSGGASITVDWTDGPASKAVEAVAEQYAGGRFDGMIDLAYSVTHWLLPDGSVELSHDPGTNGSHGAYPAQDGPSAEWALAHGARRVHFMADYIFCERELSSGTKSILTHVAEDRFGPNPKGMAPDWKQVESWRMAQEVTFA